MTTAVSGSAGAYAPTIAAYFAAGTIHAGDGLIGAVSGAFRFSYRMEGFILASEVVGASQASLYPSCEDPSARGTVWPVIGAIVSVGEPNLALSQCRIPGPGDTGVVEESGPTNGDLAILDRFSPDDSESAGRYPFPERADLLCARIINTIPILSII